MRKPSKPPVNTPAPGDRVKLRGRDSIGVLDRVDSRLWSWVKWAGRGPTICHLFELEKLG